MNPKHVTSLELSKQLKEAGIPQESEWYWTNINREDWELVQKEVLMTVVTGGEGWTYLEEGLSKGNVFSAFHLGELGEMLPSEIVTDDATFKLEEYKFGTDTYTVCYNSPIGYFSNGEEQAFFTDTEAEARGRMVLYLKKEGLI